MVLTVIFKVVSQPEIYGHIPDVSFELHLLIGFYIQQWDIQRDTLNWIQFWISSAIRFEYSI